MYLYEFLNEFLGDFEKNEFPTIHSLQFADMSTNKDSRYFQSACSDTMQNPSGHDLDTRLFYQVHVS